MDPIPTPTDVDLLHRLRRGDPGAMDEVVRRYRPRVFATALGRLRDPHLAEDVTQTVFERFLPRAHRLSDGTKLGGWLTAAVGYCCHEARRKARRRADRERRAAALAPVAYEHADPLVTDELRSAVRTSLRRLGSGDRAVIRLRMDENLSTADVGRRLGIRSDAAAKRVTRALQRLRGALEHQGIRPDVH